MSWVSPESLAQVREGAGLRPEEVEKEAKRLHRNLFATVSAQQLGEWEQGRSSPDLEHLETLAEIYGCPVGYFFLDEPPQKPLPLSFRGLAPGKEEHFGPQTQRTLQRFLELAEWIATLIEGHGLAWEVKVRQMATGKPSLGELVDEGRSRLGFGEEIRKSWKSPQQALVWWRQRIEEQGVFCFQMKLETKDVRGASVWLRGRYPFVVINHQDAEAATGRLFTLLHEYAHLLLGRDGIACDFRGRDKKSGVEPAANRFAADMLLPAPAFEQHLRTSGAYGFRQSWTDAEIDRLREPFFVSRDVVSIRLEQMQLAPPRFYRRKWDQWEQKYARWRPGGRGRPRTKKEREATEMGSASLRVLTTLEERGALPVLDAAYALDMKVEKVPEFLEWSKKQVLVRR